jgi:hypothetical protein
MTPLNTLNAHNSVDLNRQRHMHFIKIQLPNED